MIGYVKSVSLCFLRLEPPSFFIPISYIIQIFFHSRKEKSREKSVLLLMSGINLCILQYC